MANSYFEGQKIKCTGFFRNVDTGAYVDPAVVTFRTKDPSNNLSAHQFGVDPNVTKTAIGKYRYDLLLDEGGTWYLRWDSTGTHEGATEWKVICCESVESTW